ncbi:WD40 repeat domain-containing protein, partial [Endozoicomonas sp. SESOKO2]
GSWKETANITHKGKVLSADFSPDSCHVVTAGEDETAKIYGLRSNGSWIKKAIISHGLVITSAKFSPDGRNVLTVCTDYTVRITELWRGY